jgi:hypothetical protein
MEVGGSWSEALKKSKKAGGLAQVLEHLPNKCEILNLIPSTEIIATQ